MTRPVPEEGEPNPLREAALARLQETIAGFDLTELVDAPEVILETAVSYSHWVHTTWRNIARSPLGQANGSMEAGFTRLGVESDGGYAIAHVRSLEYRISPGFKQIARDIIHKIPDDPEARSLIFFRHGLQVAARLKRGREAVTGQESIVST